MDINLLEFVKLFDNPPHSIQWPIHSLKKCLQVQLSIRVSTVLDFLGRSVRRTKDQLIVKIIRKQFRLDITINPSRIRLFLSLTSQIRPCKFKLI